MENNILEYTPIEIDHLLTAVIKPSRYINNELNSYHKKPDKYKVNFCFAFPDMYEVGFSHLGLKLLYNIINNEPDATADRVYAPDKDFSELLRKHKTPLFSIENRIPLTQYDVIGFTLQSELTYTNILYMLDLANIPILAEERKDKEARYPLIIAGGPCAVYPEPLADFFDLFFIGEAEEAIIELKDTIKKGYAEKLTRTELLRELSVIEGVYLPNRFENGGDPKQSPPIQQVNARRYDGYSDGITYDNQLISWQQTTHDRYIYEIMRGCGRGCRFCLAGFLYRPVRERKGKDIIQKLTAEVVKYGWEETALLSLSSGDYSCIKPLIKAIITSLDKHKTSISLPSLRIDSLDDDIIRLLNRSGQTGITIAPEAGSQRLRDKINKDISEEQIFDLVSLAIKNRWRTIKLYFIVGLPYETMEDIKAIVTLIKKIVQQTDRRINLNVSLSPFIPKPHTPFQWFNMLTIDELNSRIAYIKRELVRYKSVKIRYHNLYGSLLECILTRGDRQIGKLIYAAYKKGAIFDGWNEYFDFSIWEQAAEELKINIYYHTKEYDFEETLPWDHISLGIDKEFLKKELLKSQKGELTEDCRFICHDCGICNEDITTQLTSPELTIESQQYPDSQHKGIAGSYKYRVFYSKTGMLKYVTHLDMLRMMHRIFKMTQLPIKYTQGFNVRPRMQFCPPLSVGISGSNEFLDIELEYPFNSNDIINSLKELNINNILWIDVKEIDFEELPLISDYTNEMVSIAIPLSLGQLFSEKTKEYNTSETWIMSRTRKKVTKEIDLKEILKHLSFKWVDKDKNQDSSAMLHIYKKIAGASIFDILGSVYGIDRYETGNLAINRERLETEKDFQHLKIEKK